MTKKADLHSWIEAIPNQVSSWLQSMMDSDRFGMFKDCADAEIPHSFPASNVGLSRFRALQGGRWEEVPGYSPEARTKTVGYIQSMQQPETGLFLDPKLDARFTNPEDVSGLLVFRRAVTAYTLELLNQLNAEPLYPYFVTGAAGKPDPVAYLRGLREGNWDEPWAIGSQAGGKTRELFFLINEGHEEYIPAVCEGIEYILSKQNPETGMWGASSIPLFQQISGALKVIGRFQFSMGFEVPHLEKLADSCIRHHADRSFYVGCDDMCIPRNVAEMCTACLEHSDYRREELLATLSSVAEYLSEYQMPDGAFASERTGRETIYWCGAFIAPLSSSPRSNMNGTQGAMYALALIGDYLDWPDMPFQHDRVGWRERLTQLHYEIVLTSSGEVNIVKRGCLETEYL